MCNTVLSTKLFNMQSTLNTEKFASAIKSRRGKQGLRDTAEEIGQISAATLSRIEQGKLPDVETFIRICKWLKLPTDTFITGRKSSTSELPEKERIAFQLRSSKELDRDTVSALLSMLDVAYNKGGKHGR
jgi:transcriptional regulator with XRE-family HTH domain